MSENYFQFPLYLLALGQNPTERVEHIVDWCLADVGHKHGGELSDGELCAVLEEVLPPDSLPLRLNDEPWDHLQIRLGAYHLDVVPGDLPTTVARAERANEFVEMMTENYGGSPMVRLRTSFLFEFLNGYGMTYRELSVLAAVYCFIGGSPVPVRITRECLIPAALGYKSPKMLCGEAGERLLASREDKVRPLTVHQLRHTLDILHSNRHFARCQASPRSVFFSHRLDSTEIREWLFKKKTRRASFLSHEREEDRKLQNRIHAVNRGRTASEKTSSRGQ